MPRHASKLEHEIMTTFQKRRFFRYLGSLADTIAVSTTTSLTVRRAEASGDVTSTTIGVCTSSVLARTAGRAKSFTSRAGSSNVSTGKAS